MKRVTERSDLASKQVPEYISGCRQFEGEDLSKLIAHGFYFCRLPSKNGDKCGPSKRMGKRAKERAPMGARKSQERRI